MGTTAVAAILQLPLPKRIEAVEAIWESIAADPLPLTDAQRRELDARLDADERDLHTRASWEAVRERASRPHHGFTPTQNVSIATNFQFMGEEKGNWTYLIRF